MLWHEGLPSDSYTDSLLLFSGANTPVVHHADAGSCSSSCWQQRSCEHPAWAIVRKRKWGMVRFGFAAMNEKVSYRNCLFYRVIFLLSFLWDAGAFGPIIVFGQWMLEWRKQVLKEGGSELFGGRDAGWHCLVVIHSKGWAMHSMLSSCWIPSEIIAKPELSFLRWNCSGS